MSSIPTSSLAPRRRRWLPLVILAVLAVVAASSWKRLQAFDWQAFGAVYSKVDGLWLATAGLLALGTYVTRVFRWEVMIRHYAPNPSRLRMLRDTVIGFAAGVLLGRPGELVRPWLIARSEQVSFSSQMAAWFLERIFDLLAVLGLFAWGLATFDATGKPIGPAIAWILNTGGALIAILTVACCIIIFFAGRSNEIFTNRLRDALSFLPDPARLRVTSILGAFTDGMAACGRANDLALIVAYTFVEWFIIVGSTVAFFRAFPMTAHLSVHDSLVYLGFVAFGSIAQVPGIGGGTQIAGMVVLSQLFNLPAEEAAGIAVANWLVMWVSILPIGLPLAARQGLRWNNLKQISQDLRTQEKPE